MPSLKTALTELSLALGLLGYDWASAPFSELGKMLSSSTNQEKLLFLAREVYDTCRTQEKHEDLCQKFISIGRKLRHNYPLFREIHQILWTGPERTGRTVSLARDLEVNSVPVSVKAESNIVFNLSPANLFWNLPDGSQFGTSKRENWYLLQSPDLYAELYRLIKNPAGLPFATVEDFEREARREIRKKLQNFLRREAQSNSKLWKKFLEVYHNMCQEVATKSAEEFNRRFRRLKGKARQVSSELAGKVFFRLNAVRYILAGMDRREEMALEIPDVSSWRRHWEVQNIYAYPELHRRQSVVGFEITIRGKNFPREKTLKFHAEIRWSHGKFSGSPEAKLYKDFAWKEVPFFKKIF